MEKIVETGIKIATVNLDGTECKVTFESDYPYFYVTNLGSSDVYASFESGSAADADGVYTIPAGSTRPLMVGLSAAKGLKSAATVYITGSGKVQIEGSMVQISGFKDGQKGGVKKSDFDALSQNVDDISNDVDLLESRFNNTVSAITTDTEVTDIRVGADGTTYQTAGEAVRGQVGELKQDLNFIETMSEFFDKTISFENAENGFIDIYSNLVTDNDRKHIDVVLQKGDKIKSVLSGKTTSCCIFAYKYPDGTYAALVNSKGADVEKYEYTSTFDGEITITISFNSTMPHSAIIIKNTAQRRVFKCSSGTSFTKALQNLSLIGDDVEKILYVEQGIYDIYKEIGGATFANTITDYNKWYNYNVFVPKNTKIIGIGHVILKMDIDVSELNSNSQATNSLSPLNIRETCSINNIRIVVSKCRYGLHIEGFGQDKYNNNLFELNNVSIQFIGDTYGFGSALGVGLNSGCTLTVNDCIFKTDKGFGIGGHINNGTAIVNVSNSAFNSKKQSFSINNNITAKNANCIFSFYNCYMPTIHVGNPETTVFNAITYNFIKTDTTMTKDANTDTVVHNDYGCTVIENF